MITAVFQTLGKTLKGKMGASVILGLKEKFNPGNFKVRALTVPVKSLLYVVATVHGS